MVFVRRNESYRRQYVKAARAGLIIFGGLVLLYGIVKLAPYIANQSDNYQTANQKINSSTVNNDFSILTVIFNGSVAFGRWAGFHHNAIEAFSALSGVLFSGILTVSTIYLWLETRRAAGAGSDQARLTSEGLKLAREEFIATHRPVIAVRGIVLVDHRDNEKPPVIRFEINNTGNSKAIVTETKFYLELQHSNGVFWPTVELIEPILPVDIEFGHSTRTFCRTDKSFAAYLNWVRSQMINDDDAIKTKIVFRVTVFYKDNVGGQRKTSAHRQYDFANGRFRKIEGSEFEYQD